MATIYETGNHIAQNENGGQRRKCAEIFIEEVQKALDGKSPFETIRFPSASELKGWIEEFPNKAMIGSGLGDLSIIHDWEWVCEQNKGKDVYIWSLDSHLNGYRCISQYNTK